MAAPTVKTRHPGIFKRGSKNTSSSTRSTDASAKTALSGYVLSDDDERFERLEEADRRAGSSGPDELN